MKKNLFLGLIGLIILSATKLNAQESKSSIELRLLFINESTQNIVVAPNSIIPAVSIKNNLLGGSILYNYHYSNDWAFYFEAASIAANINVSTTLFSSSTETSVLVPIQMGAKYYLTGFYSDLPVKPYLKAGLGLVTGMESTVKTINIEEHSETVPMASLGGGLDFKMSSWLKAGFEIKYLAMDDFDSPISQRRNYSNLEYSFGFAFIF